MKVKVRQHYVLINVGLVITVNKIVALSVAVGLVVAAAGVLTLIDVISGNADMLDTAPLVRIMLVHLVVCD